MTTADRLRVEMGRAGIGYAGPILADGRLHRFKATGDHARNSWFLLHAGPPAAGAFGCWKRGMSVTWCDRNGKLSQAEWNEVRRRWQEAEREREQAERERRAKARKLAVWILGRAKPAAASHAYVTAKGVMIFGDVREYRGALVLPLRDAAGGLHSLQFVSPDGTKRFLTGGRIAGCFYALAEKPDGPLVVCEGYATGASIHEATELATVCAMSCGNVKAVAEALRAKWPERDIVIAADNDVFTTPNDGKPWNPGVNAATEAARAVGAKLALPHFADISAKPTDFNDLHQLEGLDSVRTQLEAAATPKESDAATYEQLARLSPADYDRCRDTEAKRLRIRVATLDAEIDARRPKNGDANLQGQAVSFPDVEPWPDPVGGAELLAEILVTLRRFVVASEAALTACVLFIIHTFTFDLGDISPILFITSPTKRCGKSKLLSFLARLVNRPLTASSASAAGIYRTVEIYRPTLLIDEVDSFLKGDEQLRGLINSGHTRDAAFHLGCVAKGDNFEPRRWSTWTPKVLSGIGRLADTLEDRAVIVPLQRRKKGEQAARLHYRERFDDLRQKVARWVKDHEEQLVEAVPCVPENLHDRAADNWTPLLAIADAVAGEWPEKARQAAMELSGSDTGGAPGLRGQLLADIQAVFRNAVTDRLASNNLCQYLVEIEGRPWAEFGERKRPLSPNQLANLLREFDVAPRSVRICDQTPKGYYLEQFADAFDRYLPTLPPEGENQSATPPQAFIDAGASHFSQTATAVNVADRENAISANRDGGCGGVAVQEPAETEEMLL